MALDRCEKLHDLRFLLPFPCDVMVSVGQYTTAMNADVPLPDAFLFFFAFFITFPLSILVWVHDAGGESATYQYPRPLCHRVHRQSCVCCIFPSSEVRRSQEAVQRNHRQERDPRVH